MRTRIFSIFLFVLFFVIHSESYGQYIHIISIAPGGCSVKIEVVFNAQNHNSTDFYLSIGDGAGSYAEPHFGIYSDNIDHTKTIIVTGLLPSDTYDVDEIYYCPTVGFMVNYYGNFITAWGPLIYTAQLASNITSVAARLNGTINPNNCGGVGQVIDVYFDYGTTDSYGTSVSYGTVSANGTTDQALFYDISGLSVYTTYHFRMRAIFGVDTTYGPDTNFTTLPAAPTVTTQPVTLISTDTAVGNGNITSLGVPNLTQYGVVWNTTGNPTIADNKTTEGATGATGSFTSNITGLTTGVTYYVKAYATNAAGTVYGGEVSFTTFKIPTVTTQAVTSITTTTAVGNGNITILGVPNPNQHGVVWNTTGNPTIADNKTTQGAAGAEGSFSSNIIPLTPGTTYFVKAYVTNNAGTAYGAEVTFTSLININGIVSWNGNPLNGVSVSCNGGAPIITGDDGKYSFDLSRGGNYTIIPDKLGFTFNPIYPVLNNVIINTIQDFISTEHPLIFVTPNPLDFGNVSHLTEGKIPTIYINNPSLTKELLINKIYFRSGSAPFEILNNIAKVSVQGSDSIKIRFKTDNLGNFSNVVIFENNSINDINANEQITGKIITPNITITPTIIWFDAN